MYHGWKLAAYSLAYTPPWAIRLWWVPSSQTPFSSSTTMRWAPWIPASLAERVARELTIPVIGIGAGGAVDGQVLVVSDMLGMTNGFSPRFLRRYADLHTVMTGAIQQYVDDVKKGDFPNEDEQY